MKFNIRLILYACGILTGFTGVLMLIPMFIDLVANDLTYIAFLKSSLVSIVVGIVVALISYNKNNRRSFRFLEGVILTILSWFVIVAFGCLPFIYSDLSLSYTDAYFETMSGITTTGATVIEDLESISKGLNIWRGMVQWFGGLGIIVMGIAFLPSLKIGGMELFKIESFETFNTQFSTARKIAGGITLIYVVGTIVVILSLIIFAKLSMFDSFMHGLTSISTAGFSSYNDSIAGLNNAMAEFILIFSMIFGGLPYILIYYFIFTGQKKNIILQDAQIRGYLKLILGIILIITLYMWLSNGYSISSALRYSAFTVVSTMTGTGYVVADYSTWGYFPVMVIFFTTFIGGCAGSSACGIKVFRIQIAWQIAKTQIIKMTKQDAVVLPKYNRNIIANDVMMSLFAYFILFFIAFVLIACALSFLGLDFITAISATATCITNVGPGLGEIIGPVGNFSSLSSIIKWILIFTMLIGRLEVLVVMILFYKNFWR